MQSGYIECAPVGDGAKPYLLQEKRGGMATGSAGICGAGVYSNPARSLMEPRWYAVYTCAHHEKHVVEQLEQRAIENFLPLYEEVHRWKDRSRRLQLPLFPGYVFVRIALSNRLGVLEVPSVVRLVGFSGTPAALAEEEVEGLRRALVEGVCAKPHPYLRVGRRVRITAGPLAGHEGILKRWKGEMRVVLSIELIQRSILVDVDASSVLSLRSSSR